MNISEHIQQHAGSHLGMGPGAASTAPSSGHLAAVALQLVALVVLVLVVALCARWFVSGARRSRREPNRPQAAATSRSELADSKRGEQAP